MQDRLPKIKKEKKIASILLIISVMISVVGFGLTQLYANGMLHAHSDVISYIFLMAMIFPVITLAIFIFWLERTLAVRTLKLIETDNLPTYSKESIILSVLSGLAALYCMVKLIQYITLFQIADYMFFVFCMCGFIVFWILTAIHYFRQRSYKTHRDKLEEPDKRKVRRDVIGGIIIILFLYFVTIYAFETMFSMTKYVERSNEMRQEEMIEQETNEYEKSTNYNG